MSNTKNKECMAYKNKLKYSMEYNKENVFKKNIMFNKNNETDNLILEHIEKNKPFNSYVKKLILEDMKK